MEKSNFKAYLSLISIYIVWGTTYLAIRIGVEDLPPVLFAGIRWTIAGPILLGYLLIRNYKLPNKKDLIHLAIPGILLLGIGNGLVVFAEQYVPSGLAALLITTSPFWMVGIESLMPESKKLNRKVIFGIILGLVGVTLIFGGDIKQIFETKNMMGIIGLMVAVIGWAAGSVYSKYKKVSVQPLMGASIQMLIAGILMTLVGFGLGEHHNFHMTHNGLLALIYLILAGSLVGYVSYIYALNHLPISLVSTYAYINPIIAIFLGWLVLGEPVTIWIGFASLIILFGVMLVKKGS